MALFEPHPSRDEEIVGSDAATRALSVTVVENDFVARVYENIAWFYDLTFGPALHPGRVDAIRRMGIKPGDRLLEVGVGTGINAALYPPECYVTGVDFSSSMLEKARARILNKGVRNVRLLQMDAANLRFADDTFDIVYAPYVISVVPDPVAVTREMYRVCRPGGRIVILNHFRSKSRVGAWLERMIAPFTLYLGFKSDLDLPAFLVQADLKPVSIEKVNIPRIWSLVTSVKESAPLTTNDERLTTDD
jgi:phosphatidylethanolamine/phosphatidyl-N-methylethanolamine N-methyltransferase